MYTLSEDCRRSRGDVMILKHAGGARATVQKVSKKFNLLTLNQSNAYIHICVVFKYSYISYKNNFNFLRICVAKENLKKYPIQS